MWESLHIEHQVRLAQHLLSLSLPRVCCLWLECAHKCRFDFLLTRAVHLCRRKVRKSSIHSPLLIHLLRTNLPVWAELASDARLAFSLIPPYRCLVTPLDSTYQAHTKSTHISSFCPGEQCVHSGYGACWTHIRLEHASGPGVDAHSRPSFGYCGAPISYRSAGLLAIMGLVASLARDWCTVGG